MLAVDKLPDEHRVAKRIEAKFFLDGDPVEIKDASLRVLVLKQRVDQ
jgi:hypothetical protein